jgi:hypothetical protein
MARRTCETEPNGSGKQRGAARNVFVLMSIDFHVWWLDQLNPLFLCAILGNIGLES